MPRTPALCLVTPASLNRTVSANHPVIARINPTRDTNASYRKREHLTPAEIDKLMVRARANRHGHRDATFSAKATMRQASAY